LIEQHLKGNGAEIVKALGSILEVLEWLQQVVPEPTPEELEAAKKSPEHASPKNGGEKPPASKDNNDGEW